MQFIVITKVPPPGNHGNLAVAWEVYFEDPNSRPDYEEVLPTLGEVIRSPSIVLALRMPVFHVGEVLICDYDGREIPYPGRKPDKWDVETESFQELENALVCASQVSNLS